MVQRLRFHAANAGDAGLIRGQGTKIPHAVQRGQMIKEKKKNFFNSIYTPAQYLQNMKLLSSSAQTALKENSPKVKQTGWDKTPSSSNTSSQANSILGNESPF